MTAHCDVCNCDLNYSLGVSGVARCNRCDHTICAICRHRWWRECVKLDVALFGATDGCELCEEWEIFL